MQAHAEERKERASGKPHSNRSILAKDQSHQSAYYQTRSNTTYLEAPPERAGEGEVEKHGGLECAVAAIPGTSALVWIEATL